METTETHTQQGIRNLTASRVPELWDESAVDERMVCTDEDAYRLARDLALKEGILAGISSGSLMWGAIEQSKRMSAGVVVAVLPDRGEKYLSTPLFDCKGDPQVEDKP